MPLPLVLIHGYSDEGTSYAKWKAALQSAPGAPEPQVINICSYVTLNNEITVDDIAEGLDHALRERGLDKKQFDAIVHSTGMLVIRSWLTAQNSSERRQGLLKHLIALAPATFGSPIAAKGRSLLGRIFKGNKQLGPDFLNSGNLVLSNLELGSSYTWDLAHRDMIGKTFYGDDNATPYVFVFDGTSDYGKLAEIFDSNDQAGTDGTVRWAGCALNTRKITLDLSQTGDTRFSWSDWTNINIPMIPVHGLDHGQILQEPPDELISLVKQALAVNDKASLDKFYQETVPNSRIVQQGQKAMSGNRWQQFIVRALDSRRNPITDYSIEIVARDGSAETTIGAFEKDVRPFTADKSFRCFHVRLDDVNPKPGSRLIARVIASTGTDLVGYQGYGTDPNSATAPTIGPVDIDITEFDGNTAGKPVLFYPFTTTLIEIKLNRRPIPLSGPLEIFKFI